MNGLFLVAGSWGATATTWIPAHLMPWAPLAWKGVQGLMLLVSLVLSCYATYDYHLKVKWKRAMNRRSKLRCENIDQCHNVKVAKQLEEMSWKS